MHINHMMWQFIIVDPAASVTATAQVEHPLVYPVPSSSLVRFNTAFPVMRLRVLDLSGREVLRADGPKGTTGVIDIARLAPGNYIARFDGAGRHAEAMIVRE